MQVSCGVLLLRGPDVFTCHATGTPRWDLPKGLAEPGETALQAAVREAWEESGLVLAPASLQDLGEMPYLSGKRLHLFGARVADGAFDIAACRCRSVFPHHRTGRPTPEADAYAWRPLADASTWAGKGLAALLATLPGASLSGLPVVATVTLDRSAPPSDDP